ncbi:hypothetical protein H8S23_10895 [Anaerofilum sp. BX8]|uniref:YbbR domain-containing protein n=1 Tax=Anaerofilum hominis TaxID=2763016 RepID=A0A923IAQ3_9FIRM|nr:CdaR family protein [Anaerofilum hominis]MBC5582012.1 hypothetical protein [Anaerofilum hominis]
MGTKKQSEKGAKRRFSLWKLFENNQFNVVISIVIAVLAWLVVSMYVKPETEGTVSNIPVKLDYSAQTLQAMGLDVVSEGDAPTANVRVTGDRAVLGGLDPEDITVYPRLSNVTEAGQYELELVAVKNDSSATYTIKSVQPARITVRFATLTQKKFVVETDTSGVKPKDGYILTNAYATPGEVTLTGPQEEIRSVGRVVAKVEIGEELTSTRIATAGLTIYDKDGNVMNSKVITVDAESVEVTVPILQKKSLPVTVGYTNVPEGFDISLLKPSFSVGSINLAGPADSIQNKQELSLGYIDLQREFALGFTKDFPVTLDTGYENLDNLRQITVSFDTSAFSQKQVTVDGIRVVNEPQNRTVTVNTKRIHDVTILGLTDEVEALTGKSVVAEIDAGDLTLGEGEQTVPVTMKIPGSSTAFAVGSYTALVEISAND